MSLRRKVIAGIVATSAVFSLAACGDDSDTIKVGTTDQSQQQWQVFEQEAKKAGLNVELVGFNDYNLPNRALEDGDIDVNNFQTLMFLARYNEGNNADLTPIGATEIVPLALYYQDHSKLSDVIEAGQVAIPNDPSNQGRAIHVLEDADLVSLKGDNILSPSPADIDESKSKVKVVPVEASQTITSYKDGVPAIVNNSFLDRGGIDPKSSITQDDPKSPNAEPFINAFVTKKERKDEESLKKLVEVWHSDEVQKAIADQSKDTSISISMDGAELQQKLDKIQEQVRNE